MTIRGPGRPWHTKVKAANKRTKLLALRITPEDERLLKRILKARGESASTYAYRALLKAMARDAKSTAK